MRGYFTIERNIIGLTLREMESKLGFRPGRLDQGARIFALLKPPTVGEFLFAGSTRYSDAAGLVGRDKRRNVPIPHAWRGQRLVKIAPNLGHTDGELYPNAPSPVEQWELVLPVAAELVAELTGQQAYWPKR